MKKLKILSMLLCLGLLCDSVSVSAKEGFSWKIVSDEDEGDRDDEDDDADDDDGGDDDDDTGDDDDGDEDDDADDDDGDDDDDADDDDDGDEDDDTDDDDDGDADDDDGDDNGSGSSGSSDKSRYPSGTIYSKSEIKDMISKKYKELQSAYGIEDKFKRTKTIDSIDSYILNFAGDPLKGKKIAFLGDSITAGNGGTLTPDGSGMNYTDFIANYTSAKIVNLGMGGTPYGGNEDDNALVYRYTDIPRDSDIIVLFGGINDLFAGSKYFGSLDDPEKGTYCGDIYETFSQTRKRYSDADIYVVITYPNKMEEYKEFTGENWQEYADVQIELAKEFDFHVIDLYEEGFLDSNNTQVRNAFFKDDIHPDDLGSEVLGRHILVHLIKDYL